jgi:uncharacterized lipoprotein YajG
MKLLAVMITISILILTSCSAPSNTTSSYCIKPTEFVNELNASIIDGFYNNDTTGISKSIYLLK